MTPYREFRDILELIFLSSFIIEIKFKWVGTSIERRSTKIHEISWRLRFFHDRFTIILVSIKHYDCCYTNI